MQTHAGGGAVALNTIPVMHALMDRWIDAFILQTDNEKVTSQMQVLGP